jgi:hypothetical protein
MPPWPTCASAAALTVRVGGSGGQGGACERGTFLEGKHPILAGFNISLVNYPFAIAVGEYLHREGCTRNPFQRTGHQVEIEDDRRERPLVNDRFCNEKV